MSHPTTCLSFFVLLIFISSSCGRTQEGKTPASSSLYQLVLKDSIRLDYLENLIINDYDPDTGWFLGFNGGKNEVVLFDKDGTIQEQFSITREGPGAVTGFSLNPKFINGNIGLFTDAIYELDRKGKLLHKQELPYEFFHYVGGPSHTVYLLDGQYIYPKPENEANGRDYVSYYKSIMDGGDLLELMDKAGTNTKGTMALPENHAFEKGYFHGFPIPNLFQHDNFWTMSLPNSFEFYVYIVNENGLDFAKKVDVPVKDPILNKAVPLEDHDSYFSANGNLHIIPTIIFMGMVEDHFLALYVNGIPQTLVSQYDVYDPKQKEELLNRRFLGFSLFTEDFELVKSDIPFPKEINPYGIISMNNQQLAGLKNQEYFGVEEDFQTIYIYGLGN